MKGIKRVDRLAVMSVVQGGIAMYRTDILNVMRGIYRVSETANDFESTIMIMLKRLHV
jgi:hypothetical protein